MAFNIFWACVIIGCIFASIAKASNISDVYPPLWKESPGQFSDYKIENGKYIINFWHYPERLGTYKILLNKTAKYFAKFSSENEQNILWGLPVHHGWQYHTGKNVSFSLQWSFDLSVNLLGSSICTFSIIFLKIDSFSLSYCFSTVCILAKSLSSIYGIPPACMVLLHRNVQKNCVQWWTCSILSTIVTAILCSHILTYC